MNRVAQFVLVAAAAAGITAALLRTPAADAPSRVDRAEATGSVKQIMQVLDPSADAVWASVGTVISVAGTEERAPKTDDEWNRLAIHSVAVAEAGNLLMLPGRAVDDDEWMQRARALVDAGRAALLAAQKRDPEAVMSAGEVITNACDSCHQKYWTDTRDATE